MTQDQWHQFQIWRAILTDPRIGFDSPALFDPTIRVPGIQQAASALLYVRAVAILDEAAVARLGDDNGGLKDRLRRLEKRGDLLDLSVLEQIADTRNDIAHGRIFEIPVGELTRARDIIEQQLVAWGAVRPTAPCSVEVEVGAAGDSADPNVIAERPPSLRVKRGDRLVWETCNVWQLFRDELGGR